MDGGKVFLLGFGFRVWGHRPLEIWGNNYLGIAGARAAVSARRHGRLLHSRTALNRFGRGANAGVWALARWLKPRGLVNSE